MGWSMIVCIFIMFMINLLPILNQNYYNFKIYTKKLINLFCSKCVGKTKKRIKSLRKMIILHNKEAKKIKKEF